MYAHISVCVGGYMSVTCVFIDFRFQCSLNKYVSILVINTARITKCVHAYDLF